MLQLFLTNAAQNESSDVAYNHETEGYVFWTCQLKEREYWLFLDIYDVTKYWTSQMQ